MHTTTQHRLNEIHTVSTHSSVRWFIHYNRENTALKSLVWGSLTLAQLLVATHNHALQVLQEVDVTITFTV